MVVCVEGAATQHPEALVAQGMISLATESQEERALRVLINFLASPSLSTLSSAHSQALLDFKVPISLYPVSFSAQRSPLTLHHQTCPRSVGSPALEGIPSSPWPWPLRDLVPARTQV